MTETVANRFNTFESWTNTNHLNPPYMPPVESRRKWLAFAYLMAILGIGVRLCIVVAWSQQVEVLDLSGRITTLVLLSLGYLVLRRGYVQIADWAINCVCFGFVFNNAIETGNVAGDVVGILAVMTVANALVGNSFRVLVVGAIGVVLVLGLSIAFEAGWIGGVDFISEPTFAAGCSYCIQLVSVTCLLFLVRRSFEKTLAEKNINEVELETISSFVPLGVLWCDESGQVKLANETAKRLIGLGSMEEPVRVDDFVSPQSIAQFNSTWNHVLADGAKPISNSIRLVTSDNRRLEVRCRLGVNSWSRTSKMVIMLIEDERPSLAVGGKGLDAQSERLPQHEQLPVVAGGIAHDVNDLLLSISSRSELIKNVLHEQPGDQHELTEHLKEMDSAFHQVAELNKQLLAHARDQTPSSEFLSVNALIKRSLDLYSSKFPENVRISTSLSQTIARVRASENQMAQVLTNLLTNARQAIHGDGEISISTEMIRIQTEAHANEFGIEFRKDARDYVQLKVEDTGPGMNASVLKKIFEPRISTNANGPSIGLASVKSTVMALNGGVSVRSRELKGTTFRILFPASHPHS